MFAVSNGRSPAPATQDGAGRLQRDDRGAAEGVLTWHDESVSRR
ncbi:hypothetical protein SBD_4831 [Streptomyces bottropensis ATCC 25435]|uniref:Uncharacterized protein n=1 Tax=Streptomyces bottropensis ATCC 25435 TaxID=1054862 RepID=M3DAE5_9ACTN|nr:hypothetical protein SBD_4831 [Streptomyces bottropensis ATCC 25435]